MTRQTRKITKTTVVAVLMIVSVAVIGAGPWVYRKAKYKRLIHAVETAATPAEEREAFILAAESGVVWSTGYIHDDDHLPERVRHLKGKTVYHIEWLDYGLSKESTTAYRVILDESNLAYLKTTRTTGERENRKREHDGPADAGQ